MEHNPLFADLFYGLINWVLKFFNLQIPRDYLPTHLIMSFFVTAGIILFFKLTVKKPQLFPSKMQYVLEGIYRFFQNLVDDQIGHEGRKFLPALITLGLFICVSNLIGLLPEMASPTANINTTAGCALFIFVYYHLQGIKKHGIWGYFKTFTGPVWWMAFLMLPIELISHFSRPLSLSIRLFGNIFGEDMVIIIIASLVPFIAPVPIMILAIFTSVLQAYVFVMLSTIYLAGAVASEH